MTRQLTILLLSLLAISATAQVTRENCPRDTVDGQIIYRYTTEKSIGLWRISQNFGVSQEAIIEANPQLRERGLHLDEVLRIPGEKVEIANAPAEPQVVEELIIEVAPETVAETVVETVAETSAENFAETIASSITTLIEEAKQADTLRLAMLLPLQTSAIQRDKNMDRFMDFYEGALLAINDVQHTGQKIALYVYDVEKTDAPIRRLIEDSVLNKMSAIIGPAYPLQIAHIAELSRLHEIPTLIPFADQVSGIDTNPFLMQFNATEQQKAITLADYLEAKGDSVNCVLIEAKDADIPQSIRAVRKEIIARNIPHTWTSIHNILVDSIGSALKDSVENLLIFNTEKYGNLQVLMPRVLNAKNGRQLTLYSQFSWQKENILLPQLYMSVFRENIGEEKFAYEEAFNRHYGHELPVGSPRYDLLGYDLMHELIALLLNQEYQGVQSDIRWERAGEEGGYINSNIQVMRR